MIRLLLLDVDGTLTDGRVYYLDSGEEIKAFHIKDGLALRVWKQMGRKSAIITGRTSSIVERRAKELGIDFVFMGVKQKGEIVQRLQEELQCSKDEIASIGDDLNDLSMFAQSGMSFCPSDGARQILDKVDCVLDSKGGNGAVREMIEIILKRENLEDQWFEFFC
ncbi:KdsC family phosphatase [Helicobacter kayseriensis]|uniref:KdsC family phosphatase n=1 Tax=Helicobacter kayseriensis TaxID=2905877 RepID=UPI001E498029|nr:HAD-IIIA family hydrolase [Helicobacter kayseriensis]MCE3046718.1 HAD-IIIA family hydrolase [Helicobacter kayseriensis]MCE3047980.1 HAD-IIIA family hydrolase [Helicobacter kayseriensis]